jgi:hypothetical protein
VNRAAEGNFAPAPVIVVVRHGEALRIAPRTGPTATALSARDRKVIKGEGIAV